MWIDTSGWHETTTECYFNCLFSNTVSGNEISVSPWLKGINANMMYSILTGACIIGITSIDPCDNLKASTSAP